MIRRAQAADIPAIAAIYEAIHAQEESGALTIGWQRGVYPTQATAQAALSRNDLYVAEENGSILAAAVINHVQVDVYANVPWQYEADDEHVLVLHTLVVCPEAMHKGLGKQFVAFYEQTARSLGCTVLRMDTNARNTRARTFYQKIGYREAGFVPCVFNGLEGVRLVCLEKAI